MQMPQVSTVMAVAVGGDVAMRLMFAVADDASVDVVADTDGGDEDVTAAGVVVMVANEVFVVAAGAAAAVVEGIDVALAMVMLASRQD